MTMKIRIRVVVFAAVFATMILMVSLSLVLIPAGSAQQPSLVYATLPNTPLSQLARFSLESNSVTVAGGVVGKIGYPLSAALAFCPPAGIAYTITNIFGEATSFGGTGLGPPQVATLNLGTGAAALIGSPLPLWQDPMALECSRFGILYTIAGSDPSNTFSEYNVLYTIDRATGQLSRIGFTGVNDGTGDDTFMALRFAPDGILYGATASALFTINVTTGLATKVIDFSANVAGYVMGLAIDSAGNFYVADFTSDSHVYELDPHAGVATSILDTHLAYVHSIAFKNPR
jgi:DNA-binding beta-propeller fold protein YncE